MSTADAKKVTDPTCGGTIAADVAAARVVYRGLDFYFCSRACHLAFAMAPERYMPPNIPHPDQKEDQP